MASAAQLRSEFATNPFRASFDHNEDWKLRNQANPEFDIHNNFDDLMSVYYWVLATGFMLRGSKEVRLRLGRAILYFNWTHSNRPFSF
jgi:hypothetical protein